MNQTLESKPPNGTHLFATMHPLLASAGIEHIHDHILWTVNHMGKSREMCCRETDAETKCAILYPDTICIRRFRSIESMPHPVVIDFQNDISLNISCSNVANTHELTTLWIIRLLLQSRFVQLKVDVFWGDFACQTPHRKGHGKHTLPSIVTSLRKRSSVHITYQKHNSGTQVMHTINETKRSFCLTGYLAILCTYHKDSTSS